jgi:hypothetical protein
LPQDSASCSQQKKKNKRRKMKIAIVLGIGMFAVAMHAEDVDAAEPEPAQAAPQANAPPQPPPDTLRPRSSSSMTGYVESAIVGSQVKLQFDAGFHVDQPDRAEFFYAKCGCYRGLAGTPIYDPHSPGPGQGIVTHLNYQEVHLDLEYAPMRRLSFFADIPERSLQVQVAETPGGASAPSAKFSSAGIGDFRTGFKAAFIQTENTWVTFQFRAYAPTGDARLGLGTNHVSVEPGVLFYDKTSGRTTLAGEFEWWHPIDGANGFTGSPGNYTTSSQSSFAGDVLTYGLGGSYDLGSMGGVSFAPVVEFVGWSVLGGYQTTNMGPASAAGVNIVNAKVGLRTNFARHHSIYVGYGHALTHDIWYMSIVRLEYRYAF